MELTSKHILDQGEEVDAIVLDFSKAFDKVNNQKLVGKVKCYEVSSQVTK